MSCSASGAWEGSPEPPIAAQVSTENWYLPWYMPFELTAAGSPPDSHWAIAARVGGTATDSYIRCRLRACWRFTFFRWSFASFAATSPAITGAESAWATDMGAAITPAQSTGATRRRMKEIDLQRRVYVPAPLR